MFWAIYKTSENVYTVRKSDAFPTYRIDHNNIVAIVKDFSAIAPLKSLLCQNGERFEMVNDD